MKRETLDALQAARAAKQPAVLLTSLKSGQQMLYAPETTLPLELHNAAREALATDQSRTLETASGPVFVQVFNPPLRLLIVGAVHIAQALAPMAALAGFQVTIIDPRQAFASTTRFPGVEISTDWPDAALAQLQPDARTAVITLTHDPKLDDPALTVALRSPVFYIGSLGSRRTHAARLERLREAGFGDAELARIHGPLGLDLGARTPAEIAVSALAQVIQVLHHALR